MHMPLQLCVGSKKMENKHAGGSLCTEHGASCRLRGATPAPPINLPPSPNLGEGSHLEDAGSIRGPPGIEKVVFTSAHKPLSYRQKLGISFPNKKTRLECG